jgi:LmbE family N-acetylglucosaminyl deacetylase
MLFIPQPNDVHQDHKTVAEEAIRAFRRTNAKILGYEIIGTSNFDPNFYVPISELHVNMKIQALECYESQKKLRPYFNPEIVRSMAKMRGAAINEDYAEAFVLIKGKFDI